MSLDLFSVYLRAIDHLTLYSIITPFDTFEYHVFENIMEYGAFAPKKEMLHFP